MTPLDLVPPVHVPPSRKVLPMSTLLDLLSRFGWYAVVGLILVMAAKYAGKAANKAAS